MIDALRYGHHNAQKKVDLAVALDWYTETGKPNTRAVEDAVLELRREGVGVCSDADGYWLSKDPAEIRACADRLRARCMTQLQTAAALQDTAERLESPLTLFGEAA